MMDYILLKKYCELSGETKDSVYGRIKRGQWIDGLHYKKSKDGKIWIDPIKVKKLWIENEPVQTLSMQA